MVTNLEYEKLRERYDRLFIVAVIGWVIALASLLAGLSS